MNEEFLYYLWRFQLWHSPLQTANNELVEVINPGFRNTDGGPDFSNARIRIGDTLWAGHVEIHIKSSDWYTHHHERDPAYDTVILHVVYEDDCIARRAVGTTIPTCSVQHKFSEKTYDMFANWQMNRYFVACEKQLQHLPNHTRIMVLERLNIERLEHKVNDILVDLAYNANSWEETFYQYLMRGFGLHINADAFYQIAKRTPLKVLQKQANSRLQLEAILFGQAQLLQDDFKDSYPRTLQEEYAFLQQKFRLLPIAGGLVKFLRLRPCSFPTLRLAFFASLVQQRSQLFQEILQIETVLDGLNLLDVDVSEYWHTHYCFDKLSTEKPKDLGQAARHLIFVNTIIPFLFAFGKLRDKPELCDRAIGFLQDMPCENNHLIRQWKACGMAVNNASDSQGLLLLKKNYCDLKRCLECGIGIKLLQQKTEC
ncbi:MAG: DUF2851 family protein [Bacteroidales bacterium]|jgi:hypothetical protein|nr:DUF2851 family protein [Bacteroidales bacterium]